MWVQPTRHLRLDSYVSDEDTNERHMWRSYIHLKNSLHNLSQFEYIVTEQVHKNSSKYICNLDKLLLTREA